MYFKSDKTPLISPVIISILYRKSYSVLANNFVTVFLSCVLISIFHKSIIVMTSRLRHPFLEMSLKPFNKLAVSE